MSAASRRRPAAKRQHLPVWLDDPLRIRLAEVASWEISALVGLLKATQGDHTDPKERAARSLLIRINVLAEAVSAVLADEMEAPAAMQRRLFSGNALDFDNCEAAS